MDKAPTQELESIVAQAFVCMCLWGLELPW